MSGRGFRSPWTVEELIDCFVVRDANGQALGYFYFEEGASVVVAFRCIDSPIRTLRRRADDRRSICKRSYNMLATDLRIVSSMPQSPNPFLPHANSSAITFAQYVIAVTEASSWFWQS
jgi:hypothetical protein